MKNNHVHSKLYYHIIWATKDRQALISQDFKFKLYNYIGRTMSIKDWHLIAIGGIEDHIHILLQKRPKDLISDLVSNIKASSSRYIRERFNPDFKWQRGYGVYTVDSRSIEIVKKYILNQEEKHKKNSYIS